MIARVVSGGGKQRGVISFREESAPLRTIIIVNGELELGGGSRQDSGVFCFVVVTARALFKEKK